VYICWYLSDVFNCSFMTSRKSLEWMRVFGSCHPRDFYILLDVDECPHTQKMTAHSLFRTIR
jgi:hypothetical protein